MARTAGPEAAIDTAARVLTAIGALRREVRRTAGAPWPAKDLSNAQAELLTVLRRRPGISVAEAADEMGLAPNTVSTLVGQLARLDQLERVQDEVDRRVVRLHLAPAAQARAEAWQDQRMALVAAVIDRYDAEQRRVLDESGRVLTDLTERIRELRSQDQRAERTRLVN